MLRATVCRDEALQIDRFIQFPLQPREVDKNVRI